MKILSKKTNFDEDLNSAPDVQNQEFIDTTNDQNVVLKKAKSLPKQNTQGLSKKDLRKLNKSSSENINLRGMNISLGKMILR